MIDAPMPTRAEITDVSNAVREQADAVMLSGETTTGNYPIECVDVLKNIISSIQPTLTRRLNERIVFDEPKAMMLRSAAILSQELGERSAGIIVFTRSGSLASMLGALRALEVPIFAFTDIETTFRQMILTWGVKPFLIEFSADPDTTILTALQRIREENLCLPATWLVVVTHVLAGNQVIETMQLRQV
jgi:pyruvate kinase